MRKRIYKVDDFRFSAHIQNRNARHIRLANIIRGLCYKVFEYFLEDYRGALHECKVKYEKVGQTIDWNHDAGISCRVCR